MINIYSDDGQREIHEANIMISGWQNCPCNECNLLQRRNHLPLARLDYLPPEETEHDWAGDGFGVSYQEEPADPIVSEDLEYASRAEHHHPPFCDCRVCVYDARERMKTRGSIELAGQEALRHVWGQYNAAYENLEPPF